MEQLINFIIRPPRAEYNPKDDLLDQEFMLKGKWYQRKDLEIANKRGDTLHCSHYKPIILPEGKSLPCVIYCHGNSGCRTDASEAAVILLPLNITVFALDFSGSGLSGGEHVTLGWNEKDDLRAVVDRLREDGDVSLIGLWGRSMGAVTSLMYGAEDPSIAGMVLDSPFSDLVDLMMELVDTYKVRVPKFTVKFVIQYMRRSIQKKANFDITDLNAVKVAKSCFVPALFGHAIDDDFIQPHHSDRIYEAYMGDKNIIKFEGDHNSPRPQFYFDSISIFFKNVLQPPEEEAGSDYFDMSNDYFNQVRWSFLHDAEVSDELLGAATRSTEDAIRQLRSRRPMSSTVVPADISSKDGQPHPQIESGKNESHPLPSNMISFEFPKGGPQSSYMPDSDDDEYVEYPLDSLGDFPSNVEEEERMIMKAVMESLKDLEVKTLAGVEESSSKDLKTEPKPERDDSVSSVINTEPKKSNTVAAANDNSSKFEATTSSASKSSASLDAEAQEAGASSSTSVSLPGLQDADCKGQDHTDSSKTPTCELALKPTLDEDTSDPTSSQFVPPTRQPQTEFDVADGTTVKVEVEKREPANAVDGLLRRLDFNFFRNR